MKKEEKIIKSWYTNAKLWIKIIESNGIESRKETTNHSVTAAVCRYYPATVLDVGCGEGWLSAILSKGKFDVTGIDAVPELIEKARKKSTAHFIIGSYEDIYKGNIKFEKKFDVIVINFALLGKESVEKLLKALTALLSGDGKLVVQTLHPYQRKQIGDYKSGWKQGSWDGLSNDFSEPYEWYFRTMEDWQQLFTNTGYKVIEINEPLNRATGKPYSIIFNCELF